MDMNGRFDKINNKYDNIMKDNNKKLEQIKDDVNRVASSQKIQ